MQILGYIVLAIGIIIATLGVFLFVGGVIFKKGHPAINWVSKSKHPIGMDAMGVASGLIFLGLIAGAIGNSMLQ